jgi:hypothetical protein
MTCFAGVLLLIISIIFYIFLTSKLIPRLTLKPLWGSGRINDRGIKKYKFEGGRAVVYEPAFKFRKYVQQYILSENNEKKYVKCKLDPRITSIRYDVIAYDSKNKILEDVQVSDLIVVNSGYSHVVELPLKTSYVSVVVREVNYQQIDNSKIARYPISRLIAFLMLNVAVTLVIGLFIRSATVYVVKNLFGISAGEDGFAILIAILIGVVNSALIFLCNYQKGIKISIK